MLWLILTVSFPADDIRTRKSHFQRVPNLMVQRKSPYKDSKTRTHSHTRKKQRPQRGHRTVQRSPEATAIQSPPFLHTLKVPVRFLQRPGLHSVPVARPDFNTDSSKLNRDALLKRSEHRIRRREGEGRDSAVLMSIIWHKVCFGSKCSRTNSVCIQTLAPDVALKTTWSFHQAFLYVLYFHLSETHECWDFKFPRFHKCERSVMNKRTCKLMRIFFSSSSALDNCLTSCLNYTNDHVSGAVLTRPAVGLVCFSWRTCAGSSAAPPRLSGLSAGSWVLQALLESEVSAASQGMASDLRRKTGRPGGGRSLAGTGQKVWRAAVLCRVPEGRKRLTWRLLTLKTDQIHIFSCFFKVLLVIYVLRLWFRIIFFSQVLSRSEEQN